MLRTVLSFLTRRKPESAVKSEWKYVCLALHYCWMYREKTISKKDDLNDRYLCSSICICESAKRAAKHIILLSSTRFIAKTVWIETLMNTLKTTRKWKKQLLDTHLAYFPARRGLSRRGKIFGLVVRDLCLHPEICSKSKCVLRDVIVHEQLRRIISKTIRLCMLPIFYPTNFGFFPLL